MAKGNGENMSLFRSPVLKKTIDFRRFEISLDHLALKKLKNTGTLNAKNMVQMAARSITQSA